MTVTVDIRRLDLAWLNLIMLFRIPANLYVFLFLWVIVFLSTRYGRDLGPPDPVLATGIATFLITVVVFLGILVASSLFTVLSATAKSGILGRHTYTIEEEGLREVTDANDTLNKWSSIHRILKAGDSIFVQINWYLFHVIPRRSFDSSEQYQEFFDQCVSRWKSAT